ncbi:unnamed protein product [Rotaria sp. Silwood1]|nr:unnamed protein product [Rotaria sp. Silwood1]
MDSTFPLQGQHMQRTRNVKNIITLMSLGDPVTIVIGIIILNIFIYKYLDVQNQSLTIRTKLVIGMCFAIITMLIAGTVEKFRRDQCDPNTNESTLSIYFQLLQYIFLGFSELFATVATYEFAYFAAPRSAQSLFMSLRFCSLGISSFIGTAYITAFPTTSFIMDFSVNYRLNLRSICTLKLAQWLAFISIFICFVHGITCSFFVNIVPLVGCVTTNPILIRYFTYFFYPILTGFLPIITVSIFSLFAFRNVRHIIRRQVPIERRRLDLQITAMVLLRMGFFVAFTLPYISFRIYIVNVTIKKTDLLQYAIIQLIQAIIFSIAGLNIATSCYIFAISSSRYRRQIKYVLVKKCWQRWKSWCCFHNNRIQPENAISLGSNFELD